MRYPMSLLALVALGLAWRIDNWLVWIVATPAACTTLQISLIGAVPDDFWSRHYRVRNRIQEWCELLLLRALIGTIASLFYLGIGMTAGLAIFTGSHWWVSSYLTIVGVVFATTIMLDDLNVEQNRSTELSAG